MPHSLNSRGSTGMNRAFITNLIFLVSINFLIKPFYLFGIDRMVQNTVEDGAYGLYFTFFNLAYLLQILNDFGIQHYNNRNIAQHGQLLQKYFANILILKIGLSLLFLIALVVAALILGYPIIQWPFLLWIGLNQVLVSLIFYLRSNISGLGHYRLDSIFSVLDKVFMIFLCGSLLIVPELRQQFRIEWFVWCQTISFLLTATLAFAWVRRKISSFKLRIRPAMLMLIIKRSYPFSLILLFMAIYSRTDGVMIERLLIEGSVEAGRYASAYRLLDAANMVALLFPTLLLPMFSKLLANKSSVGPLAHLGLKTIWAGAISGALAIYFYRTEIMVFLYDSGNSYSGEILGYLILSFLVMSGTYIFGTLLLANNNTRSLNYLFAISVLLNITLNFILIPSYGALGAAIATLITQSLVLAGEFVLVYRKLQINIDVEMYLRSLVLLISVLAIHLFLFRYLNWKWGLEFFISLGLSLAISFFVKLIDLPYWVSLIKEKP